MFETVSSRGMCRNGHGGGAVPRRRPSVRTDGGTEGAYGGTPGGPLDRRAEGFGRRDPFPGPPAGWPYRVMGRWWRRSALAIEGARTDPPSGGTSAFGRAAAGIGATLPPSLPLPLSLSLSPSLLYVRALAAAAAGRARWVGKVGPRRERGRRDGARCTFGALAVKLKLFPRSAAGGFALSSLGDLLPASLDSPFSPFLRDDPIAYPPFSPPSYAASHRILT